MVRVILCLIITWFIMGCAQTLKNVPPSQNTPSPQHFKIDINNSIEVEETLFYQSILWKGTPYLRGGLTKNGIDCSGLVFVIFKNQFGLHLPRTTANQVKQGKSLLKNQLRVGDLVFFKIGPKTRHVGIYLQKGNFLHTSYSKGVMISNLSDHYWKEKFWTARRL